MPRPRIITNAMVRAACDMINRGALLKQVADRLGVDRSTVMMYVRVKRYRQGKYGPIIDHVEPVWPTQVTASGQVTPAPYARGYRW